jgi:hypothetical protein
VHEPASDSLAASEIASDDTFSGEWGEDPVFQTWSLVGALLAASEDYLRGLELLLAPDAETAFSPFPVARASLDTAARAYWLSDPSIDERARISRGMNERLYGLEEQAKLPIEEAKKRSEKQTEKILKGATAAGISIGVNSRGATRLAGEDRPLMTRAVTDLLTDQNDDFGETLARYFSAVSHGTSFGLWHRFEVDREQKMGSRTRAQLVIRPDDAVMLASGALLGYLKARQRQLDATGRSDSTWRSWHSHVLLCIARAIR